MSETTENAVIPEPAAEPVEATAPGSVPGGGEPAAEPEPSEAAAVGKAGHEAARYRRQLRETEAERDALRATVERLQWAEAERLAGQAHVTPAALRAGTGLGDLLNDDGTLDPAKVAAAASDIARRFGAALPSAPGTDGAGRVGSAIAGDDDVEPTWAAAFARRRP